jgi:hypothetical protein
VQRHLQPFDAVIDLRRIAAEFLPQSEGSGVLHMRTPDLEHILKRLSLFFERLVESGKRWVEPVGDFFGGRDVHRRGEGVVGGLAEIDVIVGVNRGLGAELSTENLAGPIRDHLVQVHVGLGAGAGLPNHQGKMTVKLAVHDFVRRGGDRLRQGLVQAPELQIGQRGGLFQQRHGADQGFRHVLVADLEVLARTLGLRPPIAVAWDLDRPKRVRFGAG